MKDVISLGYRISGVSFAICAGVGQSYLVEVCPAHCRVTNISGTGPLKSVGTDQSL